MIRTEIAIGMNGSMLDEHPTGAGVYSFNLINHLGDLDLDKSWKQITVFTPTSSLLNKDFRIVKLSDFLLSSKHGKLAAFCRFFWNTFYYPFQARNFDLLFSPTTHGSFVLKNQIITIHDLLALRYKNLNIQQTFYFKYLLPFIVSRSKLIVTVSETTKQDVIDFLNCPADKIEVIYNGYDHNRYNTRGENVFLIEKKYRVSNYILAVGPTLPHKNFETLLYAYKDLEEPLRKKHPLVIPGGKKKYTEYLKNLVQELNLEADVHFLGYVDMDLMPSLYREATVLVFPSLFEGFGLPVLEAMASGCPVITSNTSSMPEVGGEAVLYFDPLNKQQLCSALNNVLTNGGLRNALREKGLEQARKFSWEQSARSLKTIIDNQISNN